jgi:hypothetical protein
MFSSLSGTSPTTDLRLYRLTGIAVLFIALVTLVLTPFHVAAQNTQGSINGQVTDSKGAALPGATVVITSNATQVKNTTKTNDSGEYNVLDLNPGTYTVTFSDTGFKELVTDNVIVSTAAAVQVNGSLQVGGATQVVTVTADAELLSTTIPDVSTTVDRNIVENLPYPERSSLEAVLLVPGVVGDTLNPGGIEPENPNAYTNYFAPGASISIGGTPPGMSAVIIDGSDVTEASYPRAGLNLSGQVVQETTVVVAGQSAQYGRTAGGVIAQSTRSGTSEYHGAVTWRHNDPWFNAYPIGTTAKSDNHETFLGGYFGGPVRIPKLYHGDSKTFFFGSYEPGRLRSALGFRSTFLTPDDLAGELHNSLDILNQTVLKASGYAAALAVPRTGGVGFDAPVGGNPQYPLFPYGQLNTSSSLDQQSNGPLSDCAGTQGQPDFTSPTVCHDDLSALLKANPFAQYVASLMPTPSNPGPYVQFDNSTGTAATDLTNGSYKRGVTNIDNRWNVRVDHQFNNNNNIYVRYTQIPVSAARFFVVAASNPTDQTATDVEMGRDAAVGYTHVFSNTIVNTARYSFFREHLQRLPPSIAETTDFGAKFGLTPATIKYGFPNLGNFNSNGDSYANQPGNLSGSIQVDQNFIITDDLTWAHGPHSISIGFDYRWIQSNQYDLSGVFGGKYSFGTGQSLASNGQPSSTGVGGGSAFGSFIEGILNGSYSNTPVEVPGYYRYKYWAGYFQDNWRLTPKITLNLGARYEVQVPRTEAHNNQAFVSAKPIAGTLNGIATTSAFCFSGACGLQRSLWPTNYWGLEPRIGIAYAPTPKMSVRGSFSLTRQPLSGQENTPDPDFNVSGSSSGTVSNYQQDYLTNPPAPASLTSAYTQLNGRGPFNFSTGLSPVFVDQTSAEPYTEIYNMTVQYQPLSRTLVQVSYQGVHGIHLYLNPFVALNTPPIGAITNAIAQGNYLGTSTPNSYGLLANNNTSGSVLNETNLQRLEPYQNFFNQNMTEIYERNGTSNYNALYISGNQRATKDLTLLAYYTWTKSLDDVPDINNGAAAGSGQSAVQDPFNLKAEKAVSTFDQDSAFKAGYNLKLPVGVGERFNTGNHLVDNLIGNFSASGITTWITGYPSYIHLGGAGNFYQVVPAGTAGCTAASGYCSAGVLPSGYTLRPNLIPGVPIINPHWKHNPFNSLATGGVTSYFNNTIVTNSAGQIIQIGAFGMPGSIGAPAFGNAPRTLSGARSPREFLMDMRITKGFAIRESYHLNLNATFSDIFNHPVYYGPSSRTPWSSTTVSATTGLATYNSNVASFGNLSASNSQVQSRIIRVGAEFTF